MPALPGTEKTVLPRLVLLLSLLGGAACWPAASSAQPGPATRQHIVELWQQADGLPQNPEEHGYDGALPKPFTLRDLDAALARVLGSRRT
jgi:hypothetical protein